MPASEERNRPASTSGTPDHVVEVRPRRQRARRKTLAGYCDPEASRELLEVFSESEDDPALVTSRQAEKSGDVQGIPWDRLQFDRPRYRATRLQQYPNYHNCEDAVKANSERLDHEAVKLQKTGNFYSFCSNARKVRSSIVHFQLRNLVWANSKHDVYFIHNDHLKHWSAVTQKTTKVLDATGASTPGIGRIHISTCCVKDDLCALGGFNGEVVVKDLRRTDSSAVQCTRVTHSDNGITNGLEIFEARQGGPCIMASNNDALVRVIDLHTMQISSKWKLPWAVNWSTARPTDTSLVACVGDDPSTLLLDANSGDVVASLDGHVDFSFAAAWHPDGNLLATGNQDTTMRIWDMRKMGESVALVKGTMAAIRSIRFSPDGKFCAAAEAGDFVHVLDVESGFSRSQEIDLFGEVAGLSFSPDSTTLFLGISDITYSSLLQYQRKQHASWEW